MPLEDLLAKVKEDKTKEEIKLKKDHQNDLDLWHKRKKQELESLKQELEQELKHKKEDLLKKKEREQLFCLKMERLEIKKSLLSNAKKQVLARLENLPFDKKKEIYLKRIKKEQGIINQAEEVIAPYSKKQEIVFILEEAGINKEVKEGEIKAKEGFLVKGDKWFFSITLEEILDKHINQNKKRLIDILFKSL